MSTIIRGHLGLGDHLVCNGLYRYKAKANLNENFDVLVKHHNLKTVSFMLRDVRNINVVGVQDDGEADQVCEQHSGEVLRLGYFGSQPFEPYKFDREIYRQANVPFLERWNGWYVRYEHNRIDVPKEPFVFVHDDPTRGYEITRLNGLNTIRPYKSDCLFDWIDHLEAAQEIHCIDSCFAIWVDHLTQTTNKLFWHRYARKDKPPYFMRHWTILD